MTSYLRRWSSQAIYLAINWPYLADPTAVYIIISHCSYIETNDPKLKLYGGCIAVMYYGLLQMNKVFLIQVEDVRFVGEEDFKKIQVNFDY